MSNSNPEEIVKKKILNRLFQWQSWGVVLDYDDVSNLGRHFNLFTGRHVMHTRKGKRDIIVLFKVESVLWCYLIEAKAPDGGTWSADQREYSEKFEGLENCFYEVVSDPQQIDLTLERITRRTNTLLNEGEKHIFLVKYDEEI